MCLGIVERKIMIIIKVYNLIIKIFKIKNKINFKNIKILI